MKRGVDLKECREGDRCPAPPQDLKLEMKKSAKLLQAGGLVKLN
jgi:hypothetical protein